MRLPPVPPQKSAPVFDYPSGTGVAPPQASAPALWINPVDSSRMLEANRSCREILQQIAAAQEASKLMVRNYIESCVTQGIKAGRGKEVYDEFLDVIYRMVR